MGIKQHRREKLLTKTENQDGYYTVKLSRDGRSKRRHVHILVAKAFVPGYFDGAEVNHIDFDRKNNAPENLEWVTHFDNIRHSIDHNRYYYQNADVSGVNNPNYGNRLLSKRYKNDKEFAKQKQGRPGAQNGRAKPVRALFPSGEAIDFPYIRVCAKYLRENDLSKVRDINAISDRIVKAISTGNDYCGLKYQFI